MSTTEWTVLEKLLLSQAVYKYGEDNWFQIARNLKHHALLDRPSDYFNQKSCSLQYYLMVEALDKEKRDALIQDMPPVVQIARQLYTLRLEELKKAIINDEEKFLQLVSEIEEIRSGKWDDQLLGRELQHPSEDRHVSQPTDQLMDDTMEEHQPEETAQEEPEEILPYEEDTPIGTSVPESASMPTPDLPSSEGSFQSAEEDPGQSEVVQEEEVSQEDLEPPLQTSSLPESHPEVSVEFDAAHETDTDPDTTADTAPPVDTLDESVVDPVAELDSTNTKKRPLDDLVELEGPLLKRQRNDSVSSKLFPSDSVEDEKDNNILGEDQFEIEDALEHNKLEDQKEDESLTIDTSRTEYSTDVSQGTTPADTSDLNLRDGTESVAGSESNAATPTHERKRVILSKDDQRHKSWQKNINLLWREIANHKNGAMFMNPIKESIAPHYYEIVKRPMDLKTIKNKIRDGLINTTTEFERDVVLMLNNSLMYNKEGTEVYQLAREMLDDAMEQIKIFKTADTDTSASSHTRAASKADRRKSIAPE